ncbi:MAG: hypothetical protein IJ540_12045 [Prevotella sp.]|nr:hypothetical protein [Prevotella sp.]
MAKRFSLFIVSLMIALNLISAETDTMTIPQLYKTLDSLLIHQPEIMAAKEAHIREIVNPLKTMQLTADQEYELNMRLYEEYLAFRFDSAYYYIQKNVEKQRLTGDVNRFAASAVRFAHILSVSGLFDKAQALLNEIEPGKLNDELRIAYYNQRVELNLYRSEMAQYSPYFTEYLDSARYYRELLIEIAPKTSFEYITNQGAYYSEHGNVDKAIQLYNDYLKSNTVFDRRYSIITSTLAYFYSLKNNEQQHERLLLMSAINDTKLSITENRALCDLSEILLKRKDVKHAYTYLLQASADAQAYGTRLRTVQTARLTPLITKAYYMERTQAELRTQILLIILSAIALLLFILILFTLYLIYKRHRDNKKISEMNKELSRHNQEIQLMNSQMKESNRIKDEYIGRFLQLSSTLIYRGEERGKMLNRLARERKLEDLYTELKSQRFLNESIHMFHQNFDTAFLKIFPNFIEEVNRLMQPDKQFDISTDAGRLTTELRILALIRLGIDENQNIADILRSSLTTIYTYRSKIKARAQSKDSFEDDIRKIATY